LKIAAISTAVVVRDAERFPRTKETTRNPETIMTIAITRRRSNADRAGVAEFFQSERGFHNYTGDCYIA